ncbi:MAG: BamA/TamA family outer membrane protein [Mangrovicoccus sp.]|nr:BamA/TamA family outer membrane protein [Mangrovicoccus sp.]
MLSSVPFMAEALESVRIGVVAGSSETKDILQPRLEAASLSKQALEEGFENIQDILGAARADYGRMLAVLYEQGFYGPQVIVLVDGTEVSEIDLFNPPSAVERIVIAVDPGSEFTFGKTNVTPRAPNATANPITDGFAPGQPAQSGLVVSATDAGIAEWRRDGHAKAALDDHRLIADHTSSTLDVDVRLNPGPKLRFGNVKVSSTSEVSEERVREIMGFPHGEVYSPEELRVAGNRLRRSGVFRAVTLNEADEPNEDGTLDYTLTLLDEKKRRIGLRADYATLDGFTIGGFWIHRNVFGGGERLRLGADIEGLGDTRGRGTTYRVDGRLTRPATFGTDNNAFAYFLAERPDQDDYTETSIALGGGISRYFSDRLYGEIALGLRYSEAEDVYTVRDSLENGTPERARPFHHAIFPGRLEWDLRDNISNPSNGAYFNARATPYIGFNGSQSGARLFLDSRGYLGFGDGKLVLAGRAQLGSIVGSDIEETPPSFLFFSGGGNSVRGQRFESLGVPVGQIGQSGGRNFLGLSGEIRGKVSKSIGLVAFYDYGFIGAGSTPGSEGDFHAGAGLGLRYDTPIGPVRLDLATPVAGDTAEAYESVELYIGVGQAF